MLREMKVENKITYSPYFLTLFDTNHSVLSFSAAEYVFSSTSQLASEEQGLMIKASIKAIRMLLTVFTKVTVTN